MDDNRQRNMRLAEDDERTIDYVFHLDLATSREEHDVFKKPGQFVKTLAGTSPQFKRRVSNELRKYNRSADGKTESKQLDDLTEVTGYDAFAVVTPPHNLEALAKLYELSAAHYASVNAKVANIVGLGYKLVETTKTKRAVEEMEGDEAKLKRTRRKLDLARDDLYEQLEDLNEEDSLTETLVKVWRDYESTGNGYIEVGRKRDGTIGYLGHVPSHTIRVRRERDGFVQISANKAQFFRNFGDNASNPIGSDTKPNELIHIKRYSPTSTYYGVPDVVPAMQAVTGNKFANDFNIEYFENKAVPRHLITLKGANLGPTAQADLLAFFETGIKGQNHRTLFIPLPADDGINKVEFNIEAIDAGNTDASFRDYGKNNNATIYSAHRVPITKVDTASSASLAIARDADKTFKEQVCQPEQKIANKKVNRVIKEFTDAFEFELNEMTLTDADTQSKIDERYVKNGIWTANEVRVRDGMPALPGGEERVDLNAKDKIAQQQAEANADRQRDADRSAAASDSAGEARQPKGDGRAQG